MTKFQQLWRDGSTLYVDVMSRIAAAAGEWFLPLAGRFTFAAVLAGYYWASAMTKLEGLFTPTIGAYYQILPGITEAAEYDTDAISIFFTPIVLLGSWAEFVLPLLILIGLFTRGAALAMIGFVGVQSLTDIYGHGVEAATIGAWFDRTSDALILDQRLLWVFLLAVLVVKGAGSLSFDNWLKLDRKSIFRNS
jgi:putative oxidoreductase